MRRLQAVLAALAAVGSFAAPSLASADTTGTTGDGAIMIDVQRLSSPDADPNDNNSWKSLFNTVEEKQFLSELACTCPYPLRLRFRRGTISDFTGNVEVWFGNDCTTVDSTRPERCAQPSSGNKIFAADALRTQDVFLIVDANEVMFPPSFQCGNAEQTSHVYALIDRNQDQMYDVNSVTSDLAVDTQPAPEPTDVATHDAEGAVTIDWKTPTSRVDDLRSYQVLCAVNGEPIPGLKQSGWEPDYNYDAMCTGSVMPPLPDGGLGVPDAAPLPDAMPLPDAAPDADAAPGTPDAGTPGTDIDSLDPRFLCSDVIPKSNTSTRVTMPDGYVLPAGATVALRLVVIDDHKNPLVLTLDPAKPEPAQDFWESYSADGGAAEGGFCFVATAAYGDYDHPFVLVLRDFRDHTLARFAAGRAFIRWYYRNSPPLADFIRRHPAARVAAQVVLWPVVVCAGAWEYTTAFDKLVLFALLVAWRLRRRAQKRVARVAVEPRRSRTPAVAAGLAAALLLLVGAHAAHAQAVYDEEEDDSAFDEDRPPVSYWGYELKFGPYLPRVDGESTLPGNVGPYQRMFCSKLPCDPWSVMTQMELQRYFLHPMGELGVTSSLGYTQNSAHAFAQNADGTPNYSMRVNDTTSFHLLPLSLGVVYRFTGIADRTYVPIVPYAKLGLSYYIWWITKGDGSISSTKKNGDAEGGTLGWQGTLGLSVRADKIDPNASRNLETELGVEHVGFFLEATYAQVNGLGMSKKLHVGDFTWFGGVNFEF
jgi:hypothetical protein